MYGFVDVAIVVDSEESQQRQRLAKSSRQGSVISSELTCLSGSNIQEHVTISCLNNLLPLQKPIGKSSIFSSLDIYSRKSRTCTSLAIASRQDNAHNLEYEYDWWLYLRAMVHYHTRSIGFRGYLSKTITLAIAQIILNMITVSMHSW